MRTILHVLINDEVADIKDQDPSVYSFFSDLKRPFLQVKNASQFEHLLSSLEDSLSIAIWVHPNASLKKSENVDTPGEAAMTALALDGIDFNVISRYPDDVSKDLLSALNKKAIKLGSLYNEIKEVKTLNVGEIKAIFSKKKNQQDFQDERFDYALIAAQYNDEFEKIIEVFNLSKHPTLKLGGNKNVYVGSIGTLVKKNIVALYQSETGRTDASTLTTEIIKEYNPRYVFMTGVCGGDANLSLGSVVIAKFIFTFDKGKITDQGFFRELEIVKINEETVRQIKEENEKNLSQLKSILIGNKTHSSKYKQFNFQDLQSIIDPVACSAAIIDKANYFSEVIKTIDRKASAVEMESYGFARAAESTNSGNTKCVLIKSVMDNTVNKNDDAKEFASLTSAIYLKCVLENNTIS